MVSINSIISTNGLNVNDQVTPIESQVSGWVKMQNPAICYLQLTALNIKTRMLKEDEDSYTMITINGI